MLRTMLTGCLVALGALSSANAAPDFVPSASDAKAASAARLCISLFVERHVDRRIDDSTVAYATFLADARPETAQPRLTRTVLVGDSKGPLNAVCEFAWSSSSDKLIGVVAASVDGSPVADDVLHERRMLVLGGYVYHLIEALRREYD